MWHAFQRDKRIRSKRFLPENSCILFLCKASSSYNRMFILPRGNRFVTCVPDKYTDSIHAFSPKKTRAFLSWRSKQSDSGKLAHLQGAEIHLRTDELGTYTMSGRKRQTFFCTLTRTENRSEHPGKRCLLRETSLQRARKNLLRESERSQQASRKCRWSRGVLFRAMPR